MAQIDNRYARSGSVPSAGVEIDEGLRSYMLRVYNYMAGGLALSGLVAFTLFNMAVTNDQSQAAAKFGSKFLTPFGKALYGSPLMWVLVLAPLAFVLLLSFRVYKMSPAATQIAFWSFAVVMGASLSTLLLRYTGASIAQVFAITATAFAALSLFGYTTKKDLSGWGSFLIMGVIGLILAGLVNIFLQSSGLQFAISAIGVLVFAGLTAYDTQNIKDHYYEVAHDGALATKTAVMGALNLYLDFINMFQSLLYLMGDRE
ncbi:MAG TPA: Bax inhibitor-1/YccA family protein [Hyphomicrobiaceae bacterium]|nr:Bax inhibitor-1/YccA family protein [Hyphomicrobiaceae bacterium]